MPARYRATIYQDDAGVWHGRIAVRNWSKRFTQAPERHFVDLDTDALARIVPELGPLPKRAPKERPAICGECLHAAHFGPCELTGGA